jgi:hypothetical protein
MRVSAPFGRDNESNPGTMNITSMNYRHHRLTAPISADRGLNHILNSAAEEVVSVP